MMQKYYTLRIDILRHLIIIRLGVKYSINTKIIGKGLVNKSNISGFIDNSDLHKKIATLEAKAFLKSEQDEITKLQAFDLSYFRVKRRW